MGLNFTDIKITLDISGLVACIIAFTALIITIKSFIADHDRRKKQSTIEYYNKILTETCGPLRDAIRKALKEPLNNYSYRTIMPYDKIWKKKHDLQKKCFKYCRYMERFAVGIKLRIYDYKTFFNIAGVTTAKLFQQIQYLINENRHTDYREFIFCTEYKKLCRKLLKQLFS